jgi:2-amino-4-hydroxy-6-hydroxymethyldihydropteridine diphosphokinase
MAEVYLSLGSNLGHRTLHLIRAIEALQQSAGRVLKCSSFWETEPWGFNSCHPFLNCALQLETQLSPNRLLLVTEGIERRLGRIRKSVDGTYADRIVDIDILYYGSNILHTSTLTIPHPYIAERLFVLQPLNEVAPDFKHPETGLTTAEMLAKIQ